MTRGRYIGIPILLFLGLLAGGLGAGRAQDSPAKGTDRTRMGSNSYDKAYADGLTTWGIDEALLHAYRSNVSDSYFRAHRTSTETATTGTGISPQIEVSNCAIQTAIDNCVGGLKISASPGICRLPPPLNLGGDRQQPLLYASGRRRTV